MHSGIITETNINYHDDLIFKSYLHKVYRLHLKSLKNGTLGGRLTISLAPFVEGSPCTPINPN